MQNNIIDFEKAKHNQQTMQEQTAKKAFLIAQMHVFLNEAEKRRKELYVSYAKAFNESKTKEMHELALQITEAGGKLSALTKCINLVAISI